MAEPSNSLPPTEQGKNHFKLINLWQSPEERRQKYWLCRSLGVNSYRAIRMRDWRLSKIERCLGIEETYNPHTKKYDRQLNIPYAIAPRLDREPARA